MILGLDTSTPVCKVSVFIDVAWESYEWDAGRGLAKGLLQYLQEVLAKHNRTLTDVTGLIAYQGPGSFTGLRIGLTVVNTIANTQGIPIVGVTGAHWLDDGKQKLDDEQNDLLVMPEYGGEPHITTPRK